MSVEFEQLQAHHKAICELINKFDFLSNHLILTNAALKVVLSYIISSDISIKDHVFAKIDKDLSDPNISLNKYFIETLQEIKRYVDDPSSLDDLLVPTPEKSTSKPYLYLVSSSESEKDKT